MSEIFKICFLLLTLDLSLFVIAQQRPKITEHPADAIAAKEEPLTLNCKATGRPMPDITWYHNGTPLIPSERRVVLPEGSLFFLRVMQNKREQDSGTYWCEAKSTAGVAVSRNATLQIAMLRDDFRVVPSDSVALVGGQVVLNCSPPRGIPEPSVLWHLNGKPLDLSGKRMSLVDSGSILIAEVLANDAGKYECSAQSMAGSKTAPPAMLRVIAPPTIVGRHHDAEVIEGEGVDLPCELTGDPKPMIDWSRKNGHLPEGRSRVLLDNTLRIEETRAEDQGKYMCRGQNEGGNVTIQTQLFVYAVPTFSESPVDLDVKEGDTVKLPCKAQGRPKPTIVWNKLDMDALLPATEKLSQPYKNELQAELLTKDKIMNLRSNIAQTKQLLIKDNKIHKQRSKRNILYQNPFYNKSNFYVIDDDTISSGSNSSNSRVKREPGSLSVFQHIMRDIRKKFIESLNVRMKRDIFNNEKNQSKDGDMDAVNTTPVPLPRAPELIINENGDLVFKAITNDDKGLYACAALNEAGSVVKRIFINVRGANDNGHLSKPPPELSENRWSTNQNLIINAVTPKSSSSVEVSWDATIDIPSKTLILHYRVIESTTFNTVTAPIDLKRFALVDLKPHTQYEVYATSALGLSGHISNMRRGKTMDGPPTAPPTDVRVGVINTTAAYVRWSPPPLHMINGELTGYKIQIKSNITNKLLGQMSLNATTQSVVINSLSPGGRYIARVAPLTSGGLGPYSPPAPLHMNPSLIVRTPKSDPTMMMWSSSWMSGIAMGIFGICLVGGAIFAVYWAQRSKRIIKASYPSGPTLTSTMGDKQNSLWLHENTLIKPINIDSSQLPCEYRNGGDGPMTNTMVKPNFQTVPPEPYATVTLQRNIQLGESFAKCASSPNSSEYNVPVRAPLNLCDVLPPPPDHPYGSYKPPTNMTIRTNPTALSPHVTRKGGGGSLPPSRWGTMPPPIPTFPQNWSPDRQMMPRDVENNQDCDSENDYESSSVLYEQCYHIGEKGFFSREGEPTEEYYKNINMEYLEEDFESSTPPPPCPDSSSYAPMNSNLRLLSIGQTSPLNTRRPMRSQSSSIPSNQSSDSESDNRWAPRSRRNRSRSKSGDRKYLRNGNQV